MKKSNLISVASIFLALEPMGPRKTGWPRLLGWKSLVALSAKKLFRLTPGETISSGMRDAWFLYVMMGGCRRLRRDARGAEYKHFQTDLRLPLNSSGYGAFRGKPVLDKAPFAWRSHRL